MRLFRFRISVFLFSLLLSTASHAQTTGTTTGTSPAGLPTIKETVVVTATGKEEPVSHVGATITVLTREDIEARHALSLIDLLRTVPGVSATRTGGVGNLTSLWVRGGESTYNKVLLDGIPLNEPGGAFNFASLSPENIDHIEVLRGAHSALFGSDAMASVIQIFTTRPDSPRPQFNLTLDAGTYDTTHMAGGGGARAGALEYSLFGSHLQTDNREPNNENRTSTVSGSLTATTHSGASARFTGRGEFGRTGVPGPTAFGRPDLDAFFQHHDADFLAGWNQPLSSRIVQRADYAYTLTRQRSTNLVADPPYIARFGDLVGAFPSSDFLYDSGTHLQRHHVDYRVDAVIAPNQTLTGAFAYDGEGGVLTNFLSTAAPQRPERNSTGTSVQYEAISGPVSLLGGVRFENNGSFGFYAAPRVAASWLIQPGDKVGLTRLRSSIGRGIKEPLFIQSYSPSPSFLGNPDLKPERSRGYDLGLEQRFAGNRAGVEATFFANHFDDLISLGPFDPVTFASQYMNIGETRATGLELTGDAAALGPVQIHGAYTLLDSKVIRSTSSSPIFAAGRALYRRPRHSGSVEASITRARISAMVGGVFVGSRVDTDFNFPSVSSNKGYAVWNASGEFRFARRAAGFVTIDNLANRDYMEPLGYPALGRTMRVGIRTTLGNHHISDDPMTKAAISWSGGKDSCAAYHRVRAEFDFVCALTMFNTDGTRSRSHGLRPEILEAQVERLGLQPLSQRCDWATYDEAFDRGLAEASALGVTHIVFGDILFDEHKAWAERLSSGRGLIAVEPLWKQATNDLYREFLTLGARARIVTVRASELDETFLGRELTTDLLPELVSHGVDPCGERGEYHTVVTACPAFSRPLRVRAIGRATHSGCIAEDLVLDE